MDLERKLTAKRIVEEAGMSSRPEYYSGRGAILCDLSSKYLKKIHGLIIENYGIEAGKGFVEMVANMEDLAASNFLTCLFQLENRDWKYEGFQSDLLGGIAVAKDKDGNYDMISGMFGMIAALSSHGRNETEAIRRPFLEEVGYRGNQRKDYCPFDGYF